MLSNLKSGCRTGENIKLDGTRTKIKQRLITNSGTFSAYERTQRFILRPKGAEKS